MDHPVESKLCVRCKTRKVMKSFSRDSSNHKDGYQKWCKTCWHSYHQYDIQPNARSRTGKIRLKQWNKYSPRIPKFEYSFWYCQACHDMLPRYFQKYSDYFEYPLSEYIRICGRCNRAVETNHINPGEYTTLVEIVKITKYV